MHSEALDIVLYVDEAESRKAEHWHWRDIGLHEGETFRRLQVSRGAQDTAVVNIALLTIFFTISQKITVAGDFIVHWISRYCIRQSWGRTTISRCASWSLQRWCIEHWRFVILVSPKQTRCISMESKTHHHTRFASKIFWRKLDSFSCFLVLRSVYDEHWAGVREKKKQNTISFMLCNKYKTRITMCTYPNNNNKK